MHAPFAFVIAAVLMGLSAASFAELGSRMPVSASEAAYARAAFGCEVSPGTRNPLNATALSVGLVLSLALFLPIEGLADLTSRLTLVLFAVVNLSLIRIKARERTAPLGIYIAPRWLPWAGFACCLILLGADFGTLTIQ
jgi:amino acid transporter